MKRLLLIVLIICQIGLKAQSKKDTIEGWWTMVDSIHYFESHELIPMSFIGKELFDMELLYNELAPEKGIPVLVQIVAVLRQKSVEVDQLLVVPQGCDD
jgi:hypothetical protein